MKVFQLFPRFGTWVTRTDDDNSNPNRKIYKKQEVWWKIINSVSLHVHFKLSRDIQVGCSAGK